MPKFTQGAVLMLCLLLLTSLSMLGLAAASDYLLQSNMTGNLVDQQRTDQSASSALKWGENWLFGLPGVIREPACSTGCTATQVIREHASHSAGIGQRDLGWWQLHAYRAGTDPVTGTSLDSFASGPQGGGYWLIEEVYLRDETVNEQVSETAFYRVLARSLEQTGGSYSVTESIIARPWGNDSLTEPFPAAADQIGICTLLDPTSRCGRLAWRKHH
jgi:Tfp pilus assembly protein PilX